MVSLTLGGLLIQALRPEYPMKNAFPLPWFCVYKVENDGWVEEGDDAPDRGDAGESGRGRSSGFC